MLSQLARKLLERLVAGVLGGGNALQRLGPLAQEPHHRLAPFWPALRPAAAFGWAGVAGEWQRAAKQKPILADGAAKLDMMATGAGVPERLQSQEPADYHLGIVFWPFGCTIRISVSDV